MFYHAEHHFDAWPPDAYGGAVEAGMSPLITEQEWGRVVVDGVDFGDARLFPGGVVEWDWRELGTHHTPGIGIAEVERLLAAGATAVVLSRGVHEQLQVPEATVAFLRERGVEVDVLRTDLAVARYNERAARGEAVAALIHSTC